MLKRILSWQIGATAACMLAALTVSVANGQHGPLAARWNAQAESQSLQIRPRQTPLPHAELPHSELQCAAEKLHDSILSFQEIAEDFAPTHTEIRLANALVPKACRLVDATQCGVPLAQTLCEIRAMQSQLEIVEARMERYCSAQVHPQFVEGWRCVVRQWTNVMCALGTHVQQQTALSQTPVPNWQDPRMMATPGYQALEAPLASRPGRLAPTPQHPPLGLDGNGFGTSPFGRGGYNDARQVGPPSGDIGSALASMLLQRLLER